MYKKFIICAVLIAFVCVQLATSLNCYHCDGPNPCKSPSKVFCNAVNANKTNTALRQYFLNVPETTTQNFDCLHTNYTQNNNLVMEVKGCVFREHNACLLPINATVGSSWVKSNCTICSGDHCNGKSPAGTFSSSVFTVFVSVLSLMIAKIFV